MRRAARFANEVAAVTPKAPPCLPAVMGESDAPSGGIARLFPGRYLAVCFPPSRSSNLPIAIAMTKSAPFFGSQDVNGIVMHWAAYSNSRDDIERACELLRIVVGWVGSFVMHNGERYRNALELTQILNCYLAGSRCSNHEAHCIDTVNGVEVPCRRMGEFNVYLGKPRLDPSSRISIGDQIQALANERGLYVCPLLSHRIEVVHSVDTVKALLPQSPTPPVKH